jgi:delta24(24(1))-sterol reductase
MISLGLKSHLEDQTTHQNSPTHIARTHLFLRNTSMKTSNQNTESVVDGWQPGGDPRVDHSSHFEFYGSWGTGAMMVGFPLLIYYMWIGVTFYKGRFPAPTSTQSFASFCRHLAILVYEHAFPTLRAWKIYWSLFLI